MTISITARAPSDLPTSEAKIRRRLGIVLRDLNLGGGSLSILFTDDDGIRALNRDYRGIDKPTNVLALPDTKDALGEAGHLGDIALSVQTLLREA